MYSHFGRVMEDGRLSQIIIGFANEDLDIRRNNIDMFNNALPSNVVKRKVLIVEDNEINREILKTCSSNFSIISHFTSCFLIESSIERNRLKKG